MEKKHKIFQCNIKAQEVEVEGEGIIAGYISTFGNTDRDGDIFEPGAFSQSLSELRGKGLTIPMLNAHDNREVIGGASANDIIEDAKGLRLKRGTFDLDTQGGREAFSLAKKGFINSFSIGFSIPSLEDRERMENGFRFKRATLFEFSLVPVPANPEALISSVKSFDEKDDTKAVSPARTLPLADNATKWDADAAVERVRKATNSTDEPSTRYRRAFMFFDADNADNFTAYKLPFADVIDGQLRAVPRALSAIVAVLNGGRGGVDIPAADRKKIEGVVNAYFRRMGRDAPFGNDDDKSKGEIDTDLALLPLLIKLKRLNYVGRTNTNI